MRIRGAITAPRTADIRRRRVCALEALEQRRLLSANPIATPAIAKSGSTPGQSGYTPVQGLHAYGFDTAATSIGAVGGDGSGQTIAIVEAYNDPTLAADIHAFDQQFNLPDPPALQQINQAGGKSLPARNGIWSTETALDVEWAHAVAPQAGIVVVEASTDQISNLLMAVDTARHLPEVSVVSMSWGTDEFPTETHYDNIFTTPAGHQSVTFVASSGDAVTSDGVQWPAVSPNVVSVGGSTLTVSGPSGAAETNFAGAVSGTSKYEPTPGYQTGVSTPGARSTPDVVYDASPTPGFAVFDSNTGGWRTLGGTSSGAPQWAALLAIANQVRAGSGKASLNGATQTLPALYQYYNANQQATITTKSAITAGALLSTAGTPQATAVISALAANSGTAGTAASSTPKAHDLAKLANRHGHPAILNNLAPRSPLLQFAPSFATTNKPIAAVFSDRPIADGGVAQLANIGLTRGGGESLPDVSLLAQALPEIAMASLPRADDTIARMVAAIYGDIPLLGTGNVVSVGIESMRDAEPHRSWYIAHINVAATFGDALAAFINDSAVLPHAGIAGDPPSPNHLRAWLVTAVVLAADATALYYLASYRGRRSKLSGVQW